jgi:hypothetical protein
MKIKAIIGTTVAIIVCAIPPVCSFADNPVVQTNFTADPAPVVYNGTVYLYTSHDEDNATGFLMRNWMCYTTTDMANWTDHGIIASLKDFKWADSAISGWGGFDNGAWAPQCIERDGKFYMYCPVQGRGIGVLVADSPFGPFTDPLGKPLIGGQFDSIDPTVFIDDDGQAYLYWGNPHLWYAKLNKDMISVSGAPVMCSPTPAHYQEGPWFYRRNGHYYMAFASTCCPEGIGYSMSDSPTGPWPFVGYIMLPDGRSSGNHPGIIDYKGNSYVFGFNYKLNNAITPIHHERRSVCVELMTYNADGTINTVPWWSDEGPPQIGTLDPYVRNEAETICYSGGIKSELCSAGGLDVYPKAAGAYIKVKGVNFSNAGASTFTASVACGALSGATTGGVIELHVDQKDGPLIGTLQTSDTGGAWAMRTIPVSGATGTHDLYFVFTGDTVGDTLKFDYWRFGKRTLKRTMGANTPNRRSASFSPAKTAIRNMEL